VVTAAQAPFVQVPSHVDVRDGQITLINNDTPSSLSGPRSASRRTCPRPTGCCRSCSPSGTSRPASTSGTSYAAATPAATPP
jgi:hypothetical protein